jgi:nicotinate-nucleotide adenylyltransferase
MTALAVSDNPAFAVEPFEAEKPRISWTIDTVRHLKSAYPNDNITMVLGADAFQDLPLWKEPGAILASVRLAVAGRPGSDLDMVNHPYANSASFFEMPMLDISSSDIRKRVAEGRSIRYLAPWTVHTFIYARKLYGASSRP